MGNYDINSIQNNKYQKDFKLKYDKKATLPITYEIKDDEFVLSNKESKNKNEKDKKNDIKKTLKIISTTTVFAVAGLLIYRFAKGKNISKLIKEHFPKPPKKINTAGEKHTIKTAENIDGVVPKPPKNINTTKEEQTIKTAEKPVSTITRQSDKQNVKNTEQKTAHTNKNISSEPEYVMESTFDPEISRIRNGINQRIRTEAELTNKDLIKLFDFQLMNTKPEEIKKILSSFAPEDQIIVKKLLKELTQFGNMESMEDIAKAITTTGEKNNYLFCKVKNTLSDIMYYLTKEKSSFGSYAETHIYTQTSIASSSTVLLDEILLKELETNKELLNSLKNNINYVKIITPEAWITGINPFNQTKDIRAILEDCLNRVKRIKSSNPNMEQNQIIKTAIREPLFERLEKLGIDTKKINFIENSKSIVDIDSKYFCDLVANQLNHGTMNEQQLEKILSGFHEEYHPYIRELLAHNVEINSPKSLSIQLKNVYEKILKLNGGNDNGIYYIIPTSNKSYSLITMQYQLTNNIPASKILSGAEISTRLPKDAKKLIILDDVAASGDSLVEQVKNIKELSRNKQIKEVIAVPLLTTQKAQIQFEKRSIKNIINKVVNGHDDSEWYRSLSNIDKMMITKVMGKTGYGNIGSCIAFPYMAPDNNNVFFASEFAKYFTLNGQGVKNKSGVLSIKKFLSAA